MMDAFIARKKAQEPYLIESSADTCQGHKSSGSKSNEESVVDIDVVRVRITIVMVIQLQFMLQPSHLNQV